MTAKCVIVFDHWFVSDGERSFTSSGNYRPDALAKRYLNSFDEVLILGRCREGKPGVVLEASFAEGVVRLAVITSRGGPTGALSGAWKLFRALRRLSPTTAVILVLPGLLGSLASLTLRPGRYGVEMVGDAGEALTALAGNKMLVRVWRRVVARATRGAAGVAYVSASLQKAYPASPTAFTTIYSSIQLAPEALRAEVRPTLLTGDSVRLVTVARLEKPYKGVDVLLRALSGLPESCHLDVVGGGRLLGTYRSLADELGVGRRVTFHGEISEAGGVTRVLDRGDIYVQPSLTEGLPRAVIEAMARGLPCVGTRVGGIPELLDDRWLVAPGSPAELSALLAACLQDEGGLRAAAGANLLRAQRYVATTLQPRRDAFYRGLLAAGGGA